MTAPGRTAGSLLDRAYRECERITRTEARNFSYGIRLLRPERRGALCAVYAVARRIDDIGDGDLPSAAKVARLDQVRAALHQLPEAGGDPVLLALADAGDRLPIPLPALDELVDGCLADVKGTTYDTFDDLVGYCRQVAGSVGRLSSASSTSGRPCPATSPANWPTRSASRCN